MGRKFDRGNRWQYWDDTKEIGGGVFELQVYPANRGEERLLQLFAAGSETDRFVFTIKTILNPIVVARRPPNATPEYHHYWLNNRETCNASVPRIMVVAGASVAAWHG